jgi:hypothetical protein
MLCRIIRNSLQLPGNSLAATLKPIRVARPALRPMDALYIRRPRRLEHDDVPDALVIAVSSMLAATLHCGDGGDRAGDRLYWPEPSTITRSLLAPSYFALSPISSIRRRWRRAKDALIGELDRPRRSRTKRGTADLQRRQVALSGADEP